MSGHRLTETTVLHLGGPCRHPPEDYTHLSTCSRSVADLPFGKRNITLHPSVADGSLEPRSAFHCIEIFNYFHRECACKAKTFLEVETSKVRRILGSLSRGSSKCTQVPLSRTASRRAKRNSARKEVACGRRKGSKMSGSAFEPRLPLGAEGRLLREQAVAVAAGIVSPRTRVFLDVYTKVHVDCCGC